MIDRCLFYMEFGQCVQSYECLTSGRVSPVFEHPYITASSNTIRTSPKHGTEDSLETDRRTHTKPLLYMLSAMDAVGTTNHSEMQQKSSILSTERIDLAHFSFIQLRQARGGSSEPNEHLWICTALSTMDTRCQRLPI